MFQDLPLGANAAVFLLSSIAVWIAGTRVTRYADLLQTRTGIGEALVGLFVLGFVSALPELAVTVSASWAGNAELAVNNLLGGMALNVAILASADALVRREALTSAIATPTPLLQAALLIVLLSVVAGATLMEEAVQIFGIGVWAWAIAVIYVICVRVIHQTKGRQQPWIPQAQGPARPQPVFEPGAAAEESRAARPVLLAPKIVLSAAVILVAGYALSTTGDALAEQTGLGQSFFGAVFLALATSLPEISIVIAAVKIGRYEMAIADIFGANLFGLALLFVVDIAYAGAPVLSEVGRFSTFAALLGIAVTALFVAGLVERRHYRIMRMGLDSITVLLTYIAGLVLLYRVR
jgi:cation:H+ antiporter